MNHLYYGDNLDVLRRYVADESVDLVYLDPPFNSDQNYNVLFAEHDGTKSTAQKHAFEDTWTWDEAAAREYQNVVESGGKTSQVMQAFRTALGENDMLAYLCMMAPRLVELKRTLKPTGSIYLHCDPTASHYLKMLMDAIFGPDQFRNEIIWRRTGSHNSARRFGPVHDVILFYSKTDEYYFRKIFRPYMKGHVESYFKQQDNRGRYWTNALTGPGRRNGASGQPWRGYDPDAAGRHWAIPGNILDELETDCTNFNSQQKLDAIAAAGYVDFPPAGSAAMPTYRQYADRAPGMPASDLWSYQPHTEGTLYQNEECIDEDVRWLVAQGDKERLGYPTQKPLGLLARIIQSSSEPGAVVLDPFCGCGTAISAAQAFDRQWVGIDITCLATALIKNRLIDTFGPSIQFEVTGEPTTAEEAHQLAQDDPYQFQWWALGLVGARPIEQKKGADKGIDGRLYFHDDDGTKTKQVIFSVKAGILQAQHVRDLRGVIEREGAEMGVLLSHDEPTKKMRTEASTAGFYRSPFSRSDHPRLQLLTVADILNGKRIDMPALRHTQQTFKKAPKPKEKGMRQKGLLDDE